MVLTLGPPPSPREGFTSPLSNSSSPEYYPSHDDPSKKLSRNGHYLANNTLSSGADVHLECLQTQISFFGSLVTFAV